VATFQLIFRKLSREYEHVKNYAFHIGKKIPKNVGKVAIKSWGQSISKIYGLEV
jgi:hypothetical protein